MRILRLELIPIALPFREQYRTASGSLAARTMIIVRLHADTGHVGLGEAVPLSLRGGATLGQVASELTACGPALSGADLAPVGGRVPSEIRDLIWELLNRCRRQRVGPQAIAALDIALHDLAGRISGLPLWRLLGASGVREVACNATLDAGEPERIGAHAEERAAEGFSVFKVKVGVDGDLERVAAVRSAVGDEARIRVDANGAWDPERAAAMLRDLQATGIELVEQPCASLHGMASVRARTAVPVVADESVESLETAHAALQAMACDAATIKLAKVGGPLEALRIAAVVPSYLSSALDGPIGIAAAIHTAQALPRDGYGGTLANGLATLGMFASTYAPIDGLLGPVLTPPRAAGLGVDLDDDALEELRLS